MKTNTARKRLVNQSETCEKQLQRMCKNIAEDITEGKVSIDKLMEGVYDIEWITFRDHSYKAACLMVAGGGPTVWVNLQTNTVDGYWGCDKVSWGFVDNISLDDYLSESHGCK